MYPHKIQSFIKENGGVGDARNFGLNYAKAEFIGFIDSDDYVEITMYEKMYNSAVLNNSDLVVCDLEYVWEKTGEKESMPGYTPIAGVDINKSIFLAPLFSWNKLYRKKMFFDYNISFPKGLWYEDIPVTVPIFSLAKNISHVNETMIHYLQHDSSIMGAKTNPKMFDIFTSLSMVKDFYERNSLLNEYYQELEYFLTYFFLFV
jgi:glycosyltransferase involved in cell wall biosynthesis